jgi:hypothetical protein
MGWIQRTTEKALGGFTEKYRDQAAAKADPFLAEGETVQTVVYAKLNPGAGEELLWGRGIAGMTAKQFYFITTDRALHLFPVKQMGGLEQPLAMPDAPRFTLSPDDRLLTIDFESTESPGEMLSVRFTLNTTRDVELMQHVIVAQGG